MYVFDKLASILVCYFYDDFYGVGVRSLRSTIAKNGPTARGWEAAAAAIRDRAFLPGQPLELVHNKANRPLEEDTDEEAYRWLDLLIQNVERTGGEIQGYSIERVEPPAPPAQANRDPLLEFARKRQFAGDDLQACWSLVIRGLEYHILDDSEIAELLGLLRKRRDYVNNDLGFEFIGDRLRVTFLNERYFCSPEELLPALENLVNYVSKGMNTQTLTQSELQAQQSPGMSQMTVKDIDVSEAGDGTEIRQADGLPASVSVPEFKPHQKLEVITPVSGNIPPDLVEPLRALHGKDEDARTAAVRVLRKEGSRIIEPLLASFRREKVEPKAGEYAEDLLYAFRNSIRRRLTKALDDDYGGVRALALATLFRIKRKRVFEALIKATEDPNPLVRRIAVCDLGELGDPRAIAAMTRVLQDENEELELRAVAMDWLGKFAPEQVMPYVMYGLDHPEHKVRRAAVKVLRRWEKPYALMMALEGKTASQEFVALELGKIGVPSAIAPLIATLDSDNWTVQVEAARLLVSLYTDHVHVGDRQRQILPALMALLGKRGVTSEVQGVVLHALPQLREAADIRDLAFLENAYQRYRDRQDAKEQVLLHVDAQPDEPFTFETYKVFVSQVVEMVRRFRIKISDVSLGRIPSRLAIELPPLYQSNLPVYMLARCPICGGKVSEPVDTFSLSGLGWWVSEPRGFGWLGRTVYFVRDFYSLNALRKGGPSYRAECAHARAVMYGVNLHRIIPYDVKMPNYVVIGSERPGVLRPFMERDGSYAIIRALPVGRLDDAEWQPRYTVYFVSYFHEDAGAFAASLAPQDWYDDKFLWPYDQMDYDLSLWAEAGKLFWLGGKADDDSLRREPPDDFPCADEDGLVGRWAVDKKKGAKLLRQIWGYYVYKTLSQTNPVEEQALLRRGFRQKDRSTL
ncbi:MAG: HEAT repeat domain-containing protein [Anaerolineae bacterium]|nr:HEAT repeat domain-containing protein [Anaerolineae bacterium]